MASIFHEEYQVNISSVYISPIRKRKLEEFLHRAELSYRYCIEGDYVFLALDGSIDFWYFIMKYCSLTNDLYYCLP